MIYSATVKEEGTESGTWIVSPAYSRVDGQPAPDIIALSANKIVPVKGDVVLCCEGINPFDHSSVRSFDNNYGSNPLIIATFEQLFTTLLDMVVQGKMTLGEGSEKMVLGESLQTWAQSVDTAITSLYDFGKLGVAPGPAGGIKPFIEAPGVNDAPVWEEANLSENHKLD